MTLDLGLTHWVVYAHGFKRFVANADAKLYEGQVLFDHEPTEDELLEAFPRRPQLLAIEAERKRQVVLGQISTLEAQVTPRLLQEAVLGETSFYKDTKLTPAQFIGTIRQRIAVLRRQL